MTPLRSFAAVTAFAMALSPVAGALAQGNNNQERLNQILGALLGQGNSLDDQWQRGGRPLNAAQAQFQTRLDSDVRAGVLSTESGNRTRADYSALVQRESQYAADGRLTAEEREDLRDRYDALTERRGQPDQLNDRNSDVAEGLSAVAEGRAEFGARVNTALAARKISRTHATQLRADYQALIQLETDYARGGINSNERQDLDRRLDALDDRLGDGAPGANVTISPRARLADILAGVTAGQRSGALTRQQALELRATQADLVHLEAAYARANPSAEEKAYLVRRVEELEARARVNRR